MYEITQVILYYLGFDFLCFFCLMKFCLQVRSLSQLRRELNKNDLFFLGEYVINKLGNESLPESETGITNNGNQLLVSNGYDNRLGRIDSVSDEAPYANNDANERGKHIFLQKSD